MDKGFAWGDMTSIMKLCRHDQCRIISIVIGLEFGIPLTYRSTSRISLMENLRSLNDGHLLQGTLSLKTLKAISIAHFRLK